ncbi:hypothetical protein MMC10_003544 [Thelotrema lepadinum]|nr:hypothetical protein [Thelotrema lepadinum]
MVIPERQPSESSKELYERFNERYNVQQCISNFKLAWSIKERASNIESKDEERWKELIKEAVFCRLRNQARKFEGSREKRKPADAIERYRFESEHTWIMGQQILRAYSQETTNPLSAPKVDAYLCFHAHFENSEKDGGSLYKDDYVENFSRDRLVTLQRKCEKIIHGSNGQEIDWNFEFTPSPNKSFYTAKDNRDLTCFPWATCEIKHQGHINTPEETFLFCQAANGAAVSLTLLANAAAAGVEEPLIHEIRPVIAFTFTGPIARVWVAYIWDIEDLCYKHRMRCIWQGSLTNVIDNIQLCVIIERLHFWALNHLRPWLSGCIDQWRILIDNYEREASSGQDSGADREQAVQEELQIALAWIDEAKPLVGRQFRSGLEPLRQAMRRTATNKIEDIRRIREVIPDVPSLGVRRAKTIESFIDDNDEEPESESEVGDLDEEKDPYDLV